MGGPDPLKGDFDDEPSFVVQSVGKRSGSIPVVPRGSENRTGIQLRIFATDLEKFDVEQALRVATRQTAMTSMEKRSKRCDAPSHVVPFGCMANSLGQY